MWESKYIFFIVYQYYFSPELITFLQYFQILEEKEVNTQF